VQKVCARDARILVSCACHKTFCKFHILPEQDCWLTQFLRNTTSCSPCARAKAACKPFDADGAWRKAKEETARRAQARKTKQRTDAEWKKQVLEKLGKVDELVVQVRRVADALERMVGVRSKTPEDDIISWPESGGKEMETVERMGKRKQRAQSPDGAEDEGEVEEQKEENTIEGVEKGSSGLSLVAYSVGTGAT